MHIQFHTPLTASEDHANSANKTTGLAAVLQRGHGLGGVWTPKRPIMIHIIASDFCWSM
ncbi:conserved hypothetical protein [Coccidioides posadasii str. Silveira]|uniref:Uncharacterized protein n=1 Tax=Coccidioides posadasii (strain RMSCC 757 / Silveira) TaxID=443226 RepID=E9DH49_COCPS|nr:conserved hypothetical protein [Coccidioides posadasii str. Silveira]